MVLEQERQEFEEALAEQLKAESNREQQHEQNSALAEENIHLQQQLDQSNEKVYIILHNCSHGSMVALLLLIA